ncbi:MAG: class I SAM-dependent RNA methyltransferase [Spirochaetes bacterium]|nr:class I SAM-dependent RNA methyltransferase [Spirochaetota bacterium]
MIKKLKIQKPVFGGEFISFEDEITYFTPYVLPDETVEAEILSTRKKTAFTSLKKVITESGSRISPDCEKFSKCGGCSYLHTDYGTELSFKKQIIFESLERIAGLKFEGECETVSGPRYNYRSHAGIKVINGKCGFYRRQSNTVESFPEKGCMLLNEKINEYIMQGTFNKDFKIAVDSENRIITGNDSTLIEKAGEFTFSRRLDDFFQSNMYLRTEMLNTVINTASEIHNRETLLDLGCGTGFFSIPLSLQYNYTLGVDIQKSNIKSAVKNKSLNKTGKLFFEAGDMELINPPVRTFSTVIADPPRAGLSRKTTEKIISFNPENFIYVSCNPSTWARDVRLFADRKYALTRLYFIDMFPGTHHIELVSLLQKTK